MEKYCYSHPRPSVTVDVVCVACVEGRWFVLLVRRSQCPFKDFWALPGGFVEIDEDIEEAARRELKEETGLDVRDVRQFYCFGRPDRDPRGRTISIGFIAICERKEEVRGGDDAKEARWFCVRELPELAFDHNEIVGKAMETISQWRKLGIIKEVGCD